MPTMRLKSLMLALSFQLFAIATLPVTAQQSPDTLLQKQPDGSILIDRQNGWAIARGLIPDFDSIGNTSDVAAGKIWGSEIRAISDNFAQHAALQKYAAELDDATTRAKTITTVTFVFGVGVRDYDFGSKSFPFGPIWNAARSRTAEPHTCISFDQFLIKGAPVSEEDKARMLQKVINAYRGFLVAVVHGTLKGAIPVNPATNVSDDTKPESEDPAGNYYRIIISPTSVDYRLGDEKGPILCTQTFGASPSVSPVAVPPMPTDPK